MEGYEPTRINKVKAQQPVEFPSTEIQLKMLVLLRTLQKRCPGFQFRTPDQSPNQPESVVAGQVSDMASTIEPEEDADDARTNQLKSS